MILTIDLDHLTPTQVRQAEYLAALATLNAARQQFIADAAATGQARLPDDALIQRVKALEPDWRECAATLAECERRTGIPRKTLTWMCQHAGRLAGDTGIHLHCEKRANGKRAEWWLDVSDVVALRAALQE